MSPPTHPFVMVQRAYTTLYRLWRIDLVSPYSMFGRTSIHILVRKPGRIREQSHLLIDGHQELVCRGNRPTTSPHPLPESPCPAPPPLVPPFPARPSLPLPPCRLSTTVIHALRAATRLHPSFPHASLARRNFLHLMTIAKKN